MNKQIFAAIIGAALAFPIAAQAENMYVGASIGQGKQKVEMPVFSFNESATSYKLFGGYNFDKNFGAELGYADFGKADTNFGPVRAESKTKSTYVAVVGTLPVNEQFAVFAKVGIAANKVDLNFSAGNWSNSTDGNRTSAMFAVGASYNFTKTLALVAEYDNFGKVGSGDNIKVKAHMLSAGLRYSF